MKVGTTISATLALICVATAAPASTPELSAAVQRTIVLFAKELPSADARKSTARAMIAFWDSFLNRVPRLSPAETAWVKGELDTTNSDRILAILNRREGAMYSVLVTAEQCARAPRKVEEFAGKDFREEIIGWLNVALCLNDLSSTVSYLQRSGLSDGTYGGAFYLSATGLWKQWVLQTAIPAALYNK